MSEKVVCRIMKEEGLIAKRKYSSYKGEIGEAPKNLVKRNFRAADPNRLWLTDITEFSIPAGKACLSPIIDCFGGMCVAWAQSTSPNAELVNTMLDAAASKLPEGECPVSHSDRSCHCRGLAGSRGVRDAESHAPCRRRAALPTAPRWKGSWAAQGRVLLWPQLVRMVDRWFHGCSRRMHPLV